MKKLLLLTVVVVVLASCKVNDVSNNVYNEETTSEFEFMSKPGIPATEVDIDARLYLDNSKNQEGSYIGLNMSQEDVMDICREYGHDISEPNIMHAGEVMDGWWQDGTSSTQIGDNVFIRFDKAGNVYEIIFGEGYSTSRGINSTSTFDEIVENYGEPFSTVNFEGVATEYCYAMNGYYIRFAFIEEKLFNISISETVMEYVLYEFMQ